MGGLLSGRVFSCSRGRVGAVAAGLAEHPREAAVVQDDRGEHVPRAEVDAPADHVAGQPAPVHQASDVVHRDLDVNVSAT